VIKQIVINQSKTILLLGALSALLVGIGAFVGGGSFIWVFAIGAIVMNLLAYFFSDKLVLKMNRARQVSEAEEPGLHRMVAELAETAGIPKPKVYVVDDPSPNAFATGRNPKNGVVAVTTGIRSILNERELRGVLAHELAHIKNRDILIATIAAMVASAIAMIASIVKWGAIFGFGRNNDDEGSNPLALLALAIIAPIAATIIQLAISRSREYGADATGARLSGDPQALAAALAKLDRGSRRIPMHAMATPATASLFIASPFSGRQVVSWFSTHPPIAERIRRLESMATK
jgi:heat shock protein HtpX